MSTLELLKSLADETRLRIVNLLAEADELCACEIEAVLEINQSNASRHLTRLRSGGIVEDERRGHWVHFQISPQHRDEKSLVAAAITAARSELPELMRDLERLAAYRRGGYHCDPTRE
jgi:ArsR family transcriptional regulator, arsenate/arsenite/antimonite-responsive transcriptional repressor